MIQSFYCIFVVVLGITLRALHANKISLCTASSQRLLPYADLSSLHQSE